jgi:soluble lytic murein transglycosylase-like protein
MRILRTIALLAAVTCIGWNPAAAAKNGAPMPPKKPSFTAVSQPAGSLPLPKSKPAATPVAVKAAPVVKISKIEEKPAPAYNYAAFDLSRPLSSRDKKLYEDIFAAQSAAKFTDADELIAKLRDMRLLGHVLEQRYQHAEYKTSFAELKAWLDHYSDMPGASDLYDFAQKRRPAGDSSILKKPDEAQEIANTREASVEWGQTYNADVKRSPQQRKDIFALKQDILAQTTDEHLTYALKLLESDPRASLMTAAERDILKSQIAISYYYLGDMQAAYRLASQTISRSGTAVPLSAWIGGLVSWREGNYKRAAEFFEKAGSSPYASGWTQAAGSFWAARSHMRAGNFKDVTPWMEKASAHPRTFYGLLATRALGKDFNFNWEIPAFTTEHQTMIEASPAGARAMALIDVGQRPLAEKELLRLDTESNPGLATALLAYAEHAQLPKLSLRLANLLSNSETGFYDAALYPDGPWKPISGYKLDPALVYAMIRQESTFNPAAKSPKGALGLMQVMPSTARHVGLEDETALLKPAVNLDVAQDYILDLFQRPAINGDLVKLLVAYNAGPTNLANWTDSLNAANDPLLFIESIPMAETRNYVERIMANYWMYQRRGGLQTPSLDRLAQGMWVSYSEMQKIQPFETASND